MPVKRRIPKIRRHSPSTIDAATVHLLLTGAGWDRGSRAGSTGWCSGDREELAEMWEEHGAILTEEYEERFPGELPFGWWEFESTVAERRAGGFIPKLNIDRRPAEERYEDKKPLPLHWPTFEDCRELVVLLQM